MAWEERGGQRYYYRKKRNGGRIISEYIGCGPTADAVARIEETHKQLHTLLRVQARAELAAEKALDDELDALAGEIGALTTGTLLLAGYRTHKGTWRKHRA